MGNRLLARGPALRLDRAALSSTSGYLQMLKFLDYPAKTAYVQVFTSVRRSEISL